MILRSFGRGGRGGGRLIGHGRRPPGGVCVVGHPAAEHDAEGEENGRDDQRGEQENGRTPLVSRNSSKAEWRNAASRSSCGEVLCRSDDMEKLARRCAERGT